MSDDEDPKSALGSLALSMMVNHQTEELRAFREIEGLDEAKKRIEELEEEVEDLVNVDLSVRDLERQIQDLESALDQEQDEVRSLNTQLRVEEESDILQNSYFMLAAAMACRLGIRVGVEPIPKTSEVYLCIYHPEVGEVSHAMKANMIDDSAFKQLPPYEEVGVVETGAGAGYLTTLLLKEHFSP